MDMIANEEGHTWPKHELVEKVSLVLARYRRELSNRAAEASMSDAFTQFMAANKLPTNVALDRLADAVLDDTEFKEKLRKFCGFMEPCPYQLLHGVVRLCLDDSRVQGDIRLLRQAAKESDEYNDATLYEGPSMIAERLRSYTAPAVPPPPPQHALPQTNGYIPPNVVVAPSLQPLLTTTPLAPAQNMPATQPQAATSPQKSSHRVLLIILAAIGFAGFMAWWAIAHPSDNRTAVRKVAKVAAGSVGAIEQSANNTATAAETAAQEKLLQMEKALKAERMRAANAEAEAQRAKEVSGLLDGELDEFEEEEAPAKKPAKKKGVKQTPIIAHRPATSTSAVQQVGYDPANCKQQMVRSGLSASEAAAVCP